MSRILVVDDDPLAQDIVASIIQSQGWEADFACDGFAALRMLRETSYEIALVDYHLPEMDGYALAKLMRDISGGREARLHLIGVTADRFGLAARRGVDTVFDAILAKPFDPHELIRLIGSSYGGSGGSETKPLAASLLADPKHHRARLAASSFWTGRGLGGLPKVAVIPSPTPDQIDAVQVCFDIVDHDQADLLLVLDARGLRDLLRAKLEGNAVKLPVITIDQSLAVVSDACFTVADPNSWTVVANLVKSRKAM